jgi:hypothetical protein
LTVFDIRKGIDHIIEVMEAVALSQGKGIL